jgi:ABC-type glycerol-3-phosphate transport system substrate-binding protein
MTKRALVIALICLAGLAAAASAAPDRALAAAGTITTLQSSERALTVTLADGSQARFLWNADTKINGVLSPGAKVTIRYAVGTDGKNLAQQISVSKS